MLQPHILYEDAEMLAVEKPSGMTVNRASTTENDETLQDWIEKRYLFTKENKKTHKEEYDPVWEFNNRSGIVHRIDKETSGILLIAKNVASFINLQKQFKERHIKKTYIALVHGIIVPQEGEINTPIGRLPFNRMRFGVIAGGRESKTLYKTLQVYTVNYEKYKENVTLVKLFPQTGRTHQIRVHLKHINHPIFSDALYSGRKTARNDRKLLSRLFLHAEKISFLHPKTHTLIELQSELPKDLQDFLSRYCVSK
jgi:23S rRNA pseudouridine1911/1915/1917 synthase